MPECNCYANLLLQLFFTKSKEKLDIVMKAHTAFYDSLTQKTCPATVIARLEQEIQQDLDCL